MDSSRDMGCTMHALAHVVHQRDRLATRQSIASATSGSALVATASGKPAASRSLSLLASTWSSLEVESITAHSFGPARVCSSVVLAPLELGAAAASSPSSRVSWCCSVCFTTAAAVSSLWSCSCSGGDSTSVAALTAGAGVVARLRAGVQLLLSPLLSSPSPSGDDRSLPSRRSSLLASRKNYSHKECVRTEQPTATSRHPDT